MKLETLVQNVCLNCALKFRRILSISFAGKIFSKRTFSLVFFDCEDYVPELREIGLDPAVQGVPLKKKLSVVFTSDGRPRVLAF